MPKLIASLGSDLFLVPDLCNVYLLRDGAEAVCIDFGSGSVLEHFSALGIERLHSVLLTHHHRDQSEGLPQALRVGADIWVPHTEQDLFARVDAHWQARELYNSYNNREDRFSLLEPVSIAGTLKDYGRYTFGTYTFEVLPTPGHTPGSVTLLTDIDGLRVAFTGDLIAAPGKLWSLAATQWSYNGAEGVAASVASLLELKSHAPDLLLPSHGPPIPDPATAIDLLIERLLALLRARGENPNLLNWYERPFERLTPHLLWNRTSFAYSYVLLSESGKALLIDCGYDFMTGLAAGSDRAARRPTLYTLRQLKRDFGVTEANVALPTHYHDDHVAGLNLLREAEGTEVWAGENFAGILEHPERHNLPCLWYDDIPVDRVLPLGEALAWEEYTFTLYAQPGHTTYAVAIALTVDGQRVLAIGDQYAGGAEAQWNYVYNNGFTLTDYRESAALYRRVNPDLILSGHWEPYWVEPDYFDRLDERGKAIETLHRALELPRPWENPSWQPLYRLVPYQLQIERGVTFGLEVTVLNPLNEAEGVSVKLRLPRGWQAEPAEAARAMTGKAETLFSFTVDPQGDVGRRFRIGTEVYLGARRLEPRSEMLVTIL